jgi:hypothetical protein
VRMLTLIGLGALLLVFFFQCCPSAAPEAPPIQAPTEERAPPASQPPSEQPTPPPEPTPTREPTVAPVGLSPDNPVPLDHALSAPNGAVISVHGIVNRGAEAAALVQEWNMFNDEPPGGSEYVIVSASAGYEGGEQETLTISQYDFRAVVNGVIVEPPFALVCDKPLEGEMFQGGQIDGLLTFEVPQGATRIVLIYTVLFEDSYYFATE